MTTATGTLFLNPLVQPLSASGVFQASMTASFYVTGTLTPATIYSDAGLTTPVSNPATADSSGTFTPFYLDPSVIYRCILKTSAGVTIKDIDPVADLGNTVLAVIENAATPTMLGNWKFAPASGTATLEIDAVAGSNAQLLLGGNGIAGSSAGVLQYNSGNNLRFKNMSASGALVLGANAIDMFQILASGAIQGLGPVAGAMVDMTPDAGTFTGTFTGFSTGKTGTVTWARVGKLVFLIMPVITGTSNATTLTMTGLPSAIQPPALTAQQGYLSIEDNGSVNIGLYDISNSSGTVQFFNGVSGGPWTNTGTKAITGGSVISYILS